MRMLKQYLALVARGFRFMAFAIALLAVWPLSHAKPFEDTMEQRTLACTGCHGSLGRAGPDGYYPRLAGKPAGYLYNQLLNIRDGRRHYALMRNLLEPLTDAYLMEMAQYFSRLEVSYPAPAYTTANTAQLERGRLLVTQGDPTRDLPSCEQCHGKALTGAQPHVPGLLGLPRDYLNAQLGGWRTQQRKAQSPDCMAHIAGRLNTQDVAAVTHWLASQPVPANSKPLPSLPPLPAGAKEIKCGGASLPTLVKAAPAAADPLVQQGAYLARLGNCESCHTAAGGAPYAGQRAINTPFGAVFSSNLTPDKATGLGNWNADDFWQAMHHGRSKDGRLLNPAFPYTSFTQVTRADTDALFAYLQTRAPVSQPNLPHALQWPLGTQAALFAWRSLYFTPASDSAVSRGAYLVNGLGHCGECHTARNALGARTGAALGGGVMPATNWYAPSLREPQIAGSAPAQVQAIADLLKTGVTGHTQAGGPMAQVVQGSTQYLKNDDLLAMASYVQTLAGASTASAPQVGGTPPEHSTQKGSAIYQRHCVSCHGGQGAGIPGAYAALAKSRSVQLANATNVIQSVLHGGFAPATTANPRPFGMPPFMLVLSDADIAHVLTYVRNAWGNQASAITEQDVNLARKRK
jgi:cytochrome c553